MNYTTPYDRPEGLGWIATVIAAVAALVPVIVNAFSSAPKDTWSGWSQAEKQEYVRQGIIAAKEMVRQGQAATVEQGMMTVIAQVELDESWEVWKQRNPTETQWIYQAETEMQAELASGNFMQASLFSGGMLGWVIGLSLAGFVGSLIYKKMKENKAIPSSTKVKPLKK